jgi:hypothetical protein
MASYFWLYSMHFIRLSVISSPLEVIFWLASSWLFAAAALVFMLVSF